MSQLLDQSLPLDVAGRQRWLDQLPAEHADLASALRMALFPDVRIADKPAAVSTLPKIGAGDVPSGIAISGPLKPGESVGPYELIRELGAGGMAIVWLARRADGAYKRDLALKLPVLSRLRADLAQRFARERDILASLEHPLIARFYDAGISVDGLPYLALEYVQGLAITDWCDGRSLDIRERLQLFLQVLDAVQHAHTKQIIHRDLKPSNILVNESGQVRLLDFGVAKLMTENEAEEGLALTARFGRAFTPSYASPEQLRGEAASFADDLYALGVVFHELLVGSRPFRGEIDSATTRFPPVHGHAAVKPPSRTAGLGADGALGTSLNGRERHLPADLQAIAMRALAHAAEDRYESVAAFANDLQLHQGRSVLPGSDENVSRQFASSVSKARARTLKNLPVQSEQPIGREPDLLALSALLLRHRLVTLLGPGGIGKTRLALAAAHANASRFADGAYWVDMAVVDAPDKVISAVARALNLRLGSRDPKASLARALAPRQLVLVIDNCEHLCDAVASMLQAILDQAPNVAILTTSQLPLKLRSEQAYRLGSLEVPAHGTPVEQAIRCGAIELLQRRAAAADPRFRLTDDNIDAAVHLCSQLDGVALAIEMAAARLSSLGFAALRARLGERLRLLRTDTHGAPTRQQTLRATLDWSYSLLSVTERALLRRLSVFVGSFRLDLGLQVVVDDNLGEWAAIDALSALVDRSLLHVTAEPSPRYRLLETARIYATEKLDESGETDAIWVRHGRAMANAANEAETTFWLMGDDEWLARYSLESAEWLIAFKRASARLDTEVTASVCQALVREYYLRFDFSVTLELSKEAFGAMKKSAAPRTLASLLNSLASYFMSIPGINPMTLVEERVAAWRALSDRRELCLGLTRLSGSRSSAGNFVGAAEALREAQATLDSDAPSRLRLFVSYSAIGLATGTGDVQECMRLCRQAIPDAERTGARCMLNSLRMHLLDATLQSGSFPEAISMGLEFIESETGGPGQMGFTLANLCGAYLLSGQIAEAKSTARRALSLLREVAMEAFVLPHIAVIATYVSAFELASQLIGSSQADYRRSKEVPQPVEALLSKNASDACVARLGDAEHLRLLAFGHQSDTEQTFNVATQVLDEADRAISLHSKATLDVHHTHHHSTLRRMAAPEV